MKCIQSYSTLFQNINSSKLIYTNFMFKLEFSKFKLKTLYLPDNYSGFCHNTAIFWEKKISAENISTDFFLFHKDCQLNYRIL